MNQTTLPQPHFNPPAPSPTLTSSANRRDRDR